MNKGKYSEGHDRQYDRFSGQIILIQALLRGALTRKWYVRNPRLEYAAIYDEIEGKFKSDSDIQWENPHLLCRPTFVKPRRVESASDQARKDHKRKELQAELEVQKTMLNSIQKQIEERKRFLLDASRKKHLPLHT